MELDASLDTLKGIGEKTRQVFDRAGVSTIEELIILKGRGFCFYTRKTGGSTGDALSARAFDLECRVWRRH